MPTKSPTPKRRSAPPAHPTDRSPVEALFERVLGDPDDLDALRVLADALQEIADPRGELIALQCLDEPTPTQQRRIAALLKSHMDVWLGRLAAAASRGSVVFRRGFVRELGLKKAAAKQVETLIGCPEWVTVERLDVSMWPDAATLELLGDPALRALRIVDGLNDVASLAKVGRPAWHTLSLRFGITPNDIEPLCQVTNLPALRHLTAEAQDIDQALLEPVWRCPLVQQLETLVVRCRRSKDVIPLWSTALRHLVGLTILPGGMADEPGWEVRLRRQRNKSQVEFRYHWPRPQNDAYAKLAALIAALGPVSLDSIDVVPYAPPTPSQRAEVDHAAARINAAVTWIAAN